MTILKELYNGNICPGEKFVKKSGEYQKLMIKLSGCVDKLIPMIGDEGRDLWDEIRETELSMEVISDRESFIDGFCIGARMMLEVMSEDRTDRTVL
ncbi:MAG: hypothetical protein E7578_03335 [Ruminococcaceae bacterium]|nr:hypothetical protein [Oscillospiraceae bacterium]